MPDLMIEHVRTCAANLDWSTKVKGSTGTIHTVTFGATHRGPFQVGWSCTCPAGKFGRECKHIKAAKEQKCDWNEDAFMGSHADANPDGTCPKCGGPTTVIRVAV